MSYNTNNTNGTTLFDSASVDWICVQQTQRRTDRRNYNFVERERGRGGEREIKGGRERETERDRDRQTDIDRDRPTDTDRERQGDRETKRAERETKTDRQRDNRQTESKDGIRSNLNTRLLFPLNHETGTKRNITHT